MPPPTGFSSFSCEWGELLLRSNFLSVISSLRYLSMKKFSDWSYRLGPKIRQKEGVAGLAATPSPH